MPITISVSRRHALIDCHRLCGPDAVPGCDGQLHSSALALAGADAERLEHA